MRKIKIIEAVRHKIHRPACLKPLPSAKRKLQRRGTHNTAFACCCGQAQIRSRSRFLVAARSAKEPEKNSAGLLPLNIVQVRGKGGAAILKTANIVNFYGKNRSRRFGCRHKGAFGGGGGVRIVLSAVFMAAAAVLLSCWTAVFMPPPAAAFEMFGIHLFGKKKTAELVDDPKYYGITVEPYSQSPPIGGANRAAGGGAAAGIMRKYSLLSSVAATADGGKAGNADAGIKIVENTSVLWLSKNNAVAGSGGLLARARSDYERILAAFYAEGYYGPLINIRINGQEAADIPFGTELPEHSKIVIKVASGAQYYFSSAKIIGAAAGGKIPPKLEEELQTALEKLRFTQGEAARSGAVEAAETAAIEAWRRHGYAKVAVAERKIIADHAAKTVSAVIKINPGPLAHFGALTIRNVSEKPRMDTHYVAWLTGLKEGEVYSPAALSRAAARLKKLEVFRSSSLEEAEKIGAKGALPLTLTVQERPKHRFGYGGNYATLDGVGVSAYWLNRNVFGHAEQLRFDVGMRNRMGFGKNSSVTDDTYTYVVGGTFIRPGVWTPRTNFVTSLKAGREVLDNYTAQGVYFNSGFSHSFSDLLFGSLYAEAAQMKVTDAVWGKRDFTTVGLSGNLLYDSRDNKADAAKGYYGFLTLQPFYEAKYENFVGKITAEGRTYISFDKDNRFVFALRGKLGALGGAPIEELPANLLFFVGGGGSVRGYAYRSVGIYKKGGKVIGGRSMLEGSAELRGMVTDTIGLVGFIDAGLVGKKAAPDFDEDAKLGAGIGVRYKSGMGPFRVDVALPLNRVKGDSRYGLYIGIGQAF